MPIWMESTRFLLEGLPTTSNVDIDATRENMFLVCKELNRRSRLWFTASMRRNAIVHHGGLEILKFAITQYLTDEQLVTVCMRALASLLAENGVDVRTAVLGFNPVLEQVVDHYSTIGDPYIKSDAKQILSAVKQAERRVATEEISDLLDALQNGVPLKEVAIKFASNYTNSTGRMILPITTLPYEVLHEEYGINRALYLMKDYNYETVITCGLQLIITYISINGTKTTCTPLCIETILNVVSKFPDSRRVQIRCCSIIMELCDSSNGCLELIKQGALSSVIGWHSRLLRDDVGCRQLSLICVSSVCKGVTQELGGVETEAEQLKLFMQDLDLIIIDPSTTSDTVMPLNLRYLCSTKD